MFSTYFEIFWSDTNAVFLKRCAVRNSCILLHTCRNITLYESRYTRAPLEFRCAVSGVQVCRDILVCRVSVWGVPRHTSVPWNDLTCTTIHKMRELLVSHVILARRGRTSRLPRCIIVLWYDLRYVTICEIDQKLHE